MDKDLSYLSESSSDYVFDAMTDVISKPGRQPSASIVNTSGHDDLLKNDEKFKDKSGNRKSEIVDNPEASYGAVTSSEVEASESNREGDNGGRWSAATSDAPEMYRRLEFEHPDARRIWRLIDGEARHLSWQDIALDLVTSERNKQIEKSLKNSHSKKKRKSKNAIEKMEKTWSKKTFGIGKQGTITRVIANFSSRPQPQPMTVCFHFPSAALTHAHVIRLMNCLIGQFPGSKVTSVQFVDRNVKHGARGLDNRWLVTVNTNEARDYLINSGLPLFNKVLPIKAYDDVLNEEYETFMKYYKYKKLMNPRLKDNNEQELDTE